MEMPDAEEFEIEADDNKDTKDDDKRKPRPVVRTAVDLQRLKLEKLMKNPDKPIIIPEQSREKDFLQAVPNFVRNVMGSSAGAGSGEFHVYRHLRRKEYARMKFIQSKSLREKLDDEFQAKLEQNRLDAEEKTAKKRAKRLKKKKGANRKRGKQQKTDEDAGIESPNDESSAEESSEKDEEKDVDCKANDDIVETKASDEDGVKNKDETAEATECDEVQTKDQSENDAHEKEHTPEGPDVKSNEHEVPDTAEQIASVNADSHANESNENKL